MALSFAAVVPVGAWHRALPQALHSLSVQSPALSIALMDASGDPRVSHAADESGLEFAVRHHAPDTGQACAIAQGWAQTQSDIVFWLNADDRLRPDALAIVAAAFEADPGADIVYGGSCFVDPDGQASGIHEQVQPVTELLLRSNVISQPSCFVRRAAVGAVGGLNTDMHYVMDWDLWIRLYLNGNRFVRIPDELSEVTMGAGTKTAALNPQRVSEVFSLVREHAGVWAAVKSTLSLSADTLVQRRRRP